jgi:hypothetical protein
MLVTRPHFVWGSSASPIPARRHFFLATSTILRTSVAKAIAAVTMATIRNAVVFSILITSLRQPMTGQGPRCREGFG